MLGAVKGKAWLTKGGVAKTALLGVVAANRPGAIRALTSGQMGTRVALDVFETTEFDNFAAVHAGDDSTAWPTGQSTGYQPSA